MSISTIINRLIPFLLSLILALLSVVLLMSCNNSENENESVVEVTAAHDAENDKHQFMMNTNEISSGWTTFEFNNASGFDHFVAIWQIPNEGIEAAKHAGEPLVDHFYQNITEPFQMEFDPYIEGDMEFDEFADSLESSISEGAPWFYDPGAKSMGGPGFTAAGNTSETTVHLEPGEYIVECYVKNNEEIFHSYVGMLEHISVTDEASGAEEPNPTKTLTISSTEGIQVDQLTKGSHTIEIFFEDQKFYDHLLGHNVQLVRLDDKEDEELLSNLSTWIDWTQPGSLVNRAPKGAEFIGGTMQMTEGESAYFDVNLEPGDYAWIAEIPEPADHNMLKTFTITEESNSQN